MKALGGWFLCAVLAYWLFLHPVLVRWSREKPV